MRVNIHTMVYAGPLGTTNEATMDIDAQTDESVAAAMITNSIIETMKEKPDAA